MNIFYELELIEAGQASPARLQEAANVGDWFESRIHMQFTCTADEMFGNGRLTRDERIALSSAIGGALDAFRAKLTDAAPALYERTQWDDAPEAEMGMMDEASDITESGEQAMFIPLLEKAVRPDGTIPLKIIQPGWGSSGYYSPEVLQRDGPKVFTEGTQMFWDHQTATQEAEQPEGSLANLAAVLTSHARWDATGQAGPGLYADAKVFGPYQEALNQMAPHIGVSIRANGRAAQGEAAGRKGAVIQEISSAKSVDFVTKPGAGGQIVQMFEAARPGKQPIQSEDSMELEKQLKEAQARMAQIELENARLREAMTLREAREFVAGELGRTTLPDLTQGRLLESLAKNPPIKDGQLDKTTYATQISEAVRSETQYLQQVAGYGSGRIVGMGGQPGTVASGAPAEDEAKVQKRLAEAFAGLGLNEREVAHAVKGHR